jgi:DNA-binding beta-propeller fold protein YncE
LDDPNGLAVGPDGNLYVGSDLTDSVLRYNGMTGAFIDTFVPPGSGGLNGTNDIAFGPDGNLYVASFLSDSVLRYNGATGAFIDAFVPPGSGGLGFPRELLFISGVSIPEPSTFVLLGIGTLSLTVYYWRRRNVPA